MRGGGITITAAAILAAACTSGDVEVRPLKSALSPIRQPADFRVAEGHSQLALGNVGLAVEAYRKALREQPDHVDALLGLASCYDRMGRFDLSRKHYELALAVQPGDPDLYGALADSLDVQGRHSDAARVRAELAQQDVAPEASREQPVQSAALPPPPAPSVTVALAPSHFAPVAVEPPKRGARLERVSMAEVALVTRDQPQWGTKVVARTATSTTIRFERKDAAVTLLNAARVAGLAARTRAYLAQRGFRGAAIGDAPAVRSTSLIRYAEGDRARAERLAAQFGFALERSTTPRGGVTILLGRDAARHGPLVRRTA